MIIYSKYKVPAGFYIYMYLRKEDSSSGRKGTPYYIGKGFGRRAWSTSHTVPLPNDRRLIVVCEENLTEIGAWALERRFIAWFGRIDNSTGILRNRTDGGPAGNSRKGRKNSMKWAILMTGKAHPAYDHTIYCFENVQTGELVNATQGEFVKYCDVSKSGVNQLIRGVKNICNGWHLKGMPLSAGTSGKLNVNYDPTVFHWRNITSGEIIHCTKLVFRTITKATAGNVSKHIKNPARYKTIKGWQIST